MVKDNAYYPSIWSISKYPRYISYFKEYLKWSDYNSLFASLKYLVFHKSSNKSWISTSEMGKFNIRANTSDFQFINIAYESGVKTYLKKLLPAMTHFIDVGACIGEYNVWLANSGVKCFAFEPVNYAGLEENVRLNKLENLISTYRCGIGAKQEKVTFNILKTVTSSSHIDRNQGEGNIEIDTIDNVLQDLRILPEETLVIKLDVEGMEGEAIEGAKDLISNTKNLYIIYERFSDREDSIEKQLELLGNFKHTRIDSVNYAARKINMA